MKKKLFFVIPFLIFALIIGFTLNCTGKSESPQKVEGAQVATTETTDSESVKETTAPETTAAEKVEEVFNVGDSVDLKGTIITITEFKKSEGGDFDKPKEGMEYIIVYVKIDNNSDSKISYNPFYFKMQNSKGQLTDQAFTIVDSDTALSSGELISGGEIEGTITFEQPIDDSELILIYQPGLFNESKVIKFYIK